MHITHVHEQPDQRGHSLAHSAHVLLVGVQLRRPGVQRLQDLGLVGRRHDDLLLLVLAHRLHVHVPHVIEQVLGVRESRSKERLYSMHWIIPVLVFDFQIVQTYFRQYTKRMTNQNAKKLE